ncbi:hypothetical protein ACFQFC_35955 [Amorphoplanes digitatis]|uniref:Uncharacterized protein n=1 Tax=Actinoplanes digitatis TaxID=1868 RepID=A0A7W7MPN4_9ACTN|nr:hypothetical protein [Actinoplanes digitatis]MBB4761554.1 hypothetical protein [Actinoplanes digitatis]GID90662.1 hypothetical protein Adi01nite_00740 [Actinoplanes digitatis]
MIENIESRLVELAGLLREAESLRGRHAELDRRHAELAAAVAELRQSWAGELRDVERLESVSLSRVLAALRGAYAEEMSREQAEADAARYRVAEGESRLAAIQAEREAVEARLTALADVPARFAAAIDDKERHLLGNGGPQVARLLALAEERGRAEAELRELHEAGMAADAALGALGELRRQLGLASSRQTTDNLLGGALSVARPSWLDGVGWAASNADRCLAMLHIELTDVGLAQPLGNVPRAIARPDGLQAVFFSNMLIREQLTRASRDADASLQLVAGVRRDVALRAEAVRTRWSALQSERHHLMTT